MILRKNKKSPKYPTADWLNKRFSQMRWYAIYCSCFGIVKAMGKFLPLIVKCNTSSHDMITVLFKMCAYISSINICIYCICMKVKKIYHNINRKFPLCSYGWFFVSFFPFFQNLCDKHVISKKPHIFWVNCYRKPLLIIPNNWLLPPFLQPLFFCSFHHMHHFFNTSLPTRL